ncbi:hypothetical protein [Turkeypox virus]|uniref:Virion morphogenesis protein n=1 Tax=Turkeypox virus TaxID=336486 RepID=A0A0M3ZHZ1_9POXV|nr:hypothetical protein ASN15_gp125 [Turkeypox virus]ALA62499.1 hypothetical protein [Turkeypox virus]
MDKFKKLYKEFYAISKIYLENSTKTIVGEEDIEADLESLLTILPMIEKKICIINAEMTQESTVHIMRYVNYKILSFWFLRSDAVVKSVYNKITECDEKEKFVTLFKDMLISIKTISSINNMYSNIKKDTNEIVQDFKKLLEIVSLIKNTTTEQQAYKILTDNSSFITKTVNKILADGNYIIKIIALFTDIVSDKVKLEEYKDIFSFSKENIVYGIKCFNNITIDGIEQLNNKYTYFFKKLLCNIMIFQTNGIKSNQFVQIFAKLVNIIYKEIRSNEHLHILLNILLESIKRKVSVEDLKKRKVNNIQGLIGEISSNREMYKNIFVEEYACHKTNIILIVQAISQKYNIRYNDNDLDIEYIFNFLQDNYISKL